MMLRGRVLRKKRNDIVERINRECTLLGEGTTAEGKGNSKTEEKKKQRSKAIRRKQKEKDHTADQTKVNQKQSNRRGKTTSTITRSIKDLKKSLKPPVIQVSKTTEFDTIPRRSERKKRSKFDELRQKGEVNQVLKHSQCLYIVLNTLLKCCC